MAHLELLCMRNVVELSNRPKLNYKKFKSKGTHASCQLDKALGNHVLPYTTSLVWLRKRGKVKGQCVRRLLLGRRGR